MLISPFISISINSRKSLGLKRLESSVVNENISCGIANFTLSLNLKCSKSVLFTPGDIFSILQLKISARLYFCRIISLYHTVLFLLKISHLDQFIAIILFGSFKMALVTIRDDQLVKTLAVFKPVGFIGDLGGGMKELKSGSLSYRKSVVCLPGFKAETKQQKGGVNIIDPLDVRCFLTRLVNHTHL